MVRLALAQTVLEGEREANVVKALGIMDEAAKQGADIVCFPESSFNQYFCQYRGQRKYWSLAEPVPGPTVERFGEKAGQLGLVTAINLFEKAGRAEYYNCTAVIDADGRFLGKSHKMHIPEQALANEKFYTWPGKTGYPVYETAKAKIGIAICYDRHFPEHFRALALGGAEIVLVQVAAGIGPMEKIW